MSIATGDSTDNQILLRVAEVARRLQLAKSTVYMLVSSGELPAVRFGRAVRVPASRLSEFVAAKTSDETGSDNSELKSV